MFQKSVTLNFFNCIDTPNPWPKHRCLGQGLGVSVQLKKYVFSKLWI